ncbi:MAG: response regulator transcription factor [Acidobacteriota bacterium]
MTPPIRILIVEDHLIARVGLATIVGAQPDMVVVGEARTGPDAVIVHAARHPDVTLMDLRLPELGGVDVMAAIRRETPQARFVALSTYSGDEEIRSAIAAGAAAYLTKDVIDVDLITTIRVVHGGGTYLPPPVRAILARQPSSPQLTPREREVLGFIVGGYGNKQIAHELQIAEYTVKNHVKSILDKLDVNDRTEAAMAALRRGIVL